MKNLLISTICFVSVLLSANAEFLTGTVPAPSGVNNIPGIFVDRTEWESEINARGWQVVTQDFSTVAAGSTSVSVGDAMFDFSTGGVDDIDQRYEALVNGMFPTDERPDIPGLDDNLSMDFVSGSIFGYAFNFGSAISEGEMTAEDVNGLATDPMDSFTSGESFIGVLSTVQLDPLADNQEARIFFQDSNTVDSEGNIIPREATLDNLSIAQPLSNPVPEPSTAVLLGIGMIGLVSIRYRRWKGTA